MVVKKNSQVSDSKTVFSWVLAFRPDEPVGALELPMDYTSRLEVSGDICGADGAGSLSPKNSSLFRYRLRRLTILLVVAVDPLCSPDAAAPDWRLDLFICIWERSRRRKHIVYGFADEAVEEGVVEVAVDDQLEVVEAVHPQRH